MSIRIPRLPVIKRKVSARAEYKRLEEIPWKAAKMVCSYIAGLIRKDVGEEIKWIVYQAADIPIRTFYAFFNGKRVYLYLTEAWMPGFPAKKCLDFQLTLDYITEEKILRREVVSKVLRIPLEPEDYNKMSDAWRRVKESPWKSEFPLRSRLLLPNITSAYGVLHPEHLYDAGFVKIMIITFMAVEQ